MNSVGAIGEVSTWPRKALRRGRFVLLAGLSLVLGVACLYGYVWYSSRADFAAAIAEADELDPGWRLEELDAKRPVVPDSENGALRIIAVEALLPDPWHWAYGPASIPSGGGDLEYILQKMPPNRLLLPAQSAMTKAALAGHEKALAEAHTLATMPKVRYSPAPDVPYAYPIFYATVNRYTSAVFTVMRLLTWDAVGRGDRKDSDGALLCCHAILRAGQSCGQLPDWHGQAWQTITGQHTCRILERTLAQGEASPTALADCQNLLEEDEASPLFLQGARALRAEVEAMAEWQSGGSDGPVQAMLMNSSLHHRARVLRALNQAVEIGKLTESAQAGELESFRIPPAPEWPYLGRVAYTLDAEKLIRILAKEEKRWRADVRSAISVLAAERYRKERGAWPMNLDALVPEYLPQVPLDPFDGKPLRLRHLSDGIVIYSIGLDLQDDGGDIDRSNQDVRNKDRGIRLWDVPLRRQPP
jgi:hypothetical protein